MWPRQSGTVLSTRRICTANVPVTGPSTVRRSLVFPSALASRTSVPASIASPLTAAVEPALPSTSAKKAARFVTADASDTPS